MKEEDLIRAWNHVRLSEEKKSQLKDTLRLKDSAEGTTYKKVHEPYDLENGRRLEMFKTKKRIVVLAAAVIMALGITAFAATGIISNWYSSSSSIPDYRTLPSAEQVKKDIGYDVILIESFSNGYSFKNGRIVNNKLTDEDNQTIEKFKSVAFCYKKGRDEVEFTQDQYQSDSEKTGEIAETVNGVDIYYYRYVNKIVPPDYQLTEEDMVRVLTEPKNSLTKQYQALFDMDGVKLTFEHDALLEIAKKSIERKTGARGLRAIMEAVMMDDMYHIPSDDSVREVVITKDKVDRNLILRDHGRDVLAIEDSETSKKDKKSA